MSDQSRVWIGATVGAALGAAATYLFFTEQGRQLLDRLEPAVDDMRREFTRLQKTVEKVRDLANDSIRVLTDFNASRAQYPYATDETSH